VVKLIKGLSLIAVLAFSGQVLSQGSIAVVDAQRAILETDIAKERLQALRKSADFIANKKQLEDIQKEGEALIKRVQKDAETMSAEQKSEQQKKLQEKQADLQFIAGKLQKAEQELARGLMAELGAKAKAAISDVIKADGIGLLLDSQTAIHADAGYDITAKVTQRLNENK
jgi:outer membrane protein